VRQDSGWGNQGGGGGGGYEMKEGIFKQSAAAADGQPA